MTRLRTIRALATTLAVLALAGCATFVDSEASRLCRTILPAFNPDNSRRDLRAIDEFKSSTGNQTIVAIRYLSSASAERPQAHALTCTFAPQNQKQSTNGLIDVATEHGSIGPIRLHLLKTQWLGSARAALSDPTPVLTVGPMPEWPTPLAITVQLLLAALPTIAIYALLAAAYSLIYGLIGRINLAFGELAMLAAYAAFLGFSLITASDLTTAIATAVAVGIATCLIYGYTLGRVILQPMTRIASTHTGQHVLIATIGLSIALSELLRLTQGTGVRWISPILNTLRNRPIRRLPRHGNNDGIYRHNHRRQCCSAHCRQLGVLALWQALARQR